MIISFPTQLNYQPVRIVSLVPSQTELLHDLGLAESVVGITKFCIHPKEWLQTKAIIGGTKNFHPEKVKVLQPDLIIANKEENIKEQVEALAKEFNVYVTDIATLDDALQMILNIGTLTHTASKANEIVNNTRQCFKTIMPVRKIKTAYLIWQNPYITVGSDTFIHSMLNCCGLQNIFVKQTRYPSIEIGDLKECELLLLSSEPYPFKQKHIDELQKHLPNTKIMLADGEMFSWYGSRLLHAPAYFNRLLRQIP